MSEEKNIGIVLYEKIDNPISAIETLGAMFAGSGMFGCEKKEQGMVLAMQCLSERISPLDLARRYHIIEGKLSKRADAIQADFENDGGIVEWIRTDDEVCEVKCTHPKAPKPMTVTVELKKLIERGIAIGKNGNLKDNYRKFPANMLRARAISECVRIVRPAMLVGVYTPEEISDFDKPEPTAPPRKPGLKTKIISETTGPDKPEPPMGTGEDLANAMGDKPAEPITQAQLGMVHAMFNDVGIKDADGRKQKRIEMIGVNCESNKDLTSEQASKLIELLQEWKRNGKAA